MQSDRSKINRRDYIKYAFVTAVGIAGSAGIFWGMWRKAPSNYRTVTTSSKNAEVTETLTSSVDSNIEKKTTTTSVQSRKSLVSIVRGNSGTEIEAMVLRSLDAMGGMEKIVSTGEKVVVKPSVFTSDKDCSPDPRVVATVAKLAKEAGGRVVVAESSGNGDTTFNMSKVGIVSAIEDIGVEIKDLQTEKEVEITVPNGLALHQVKTYPTIQNCDVLISVPKLKRHSSATVTISLKNMMGTLPRREMQRFHIINLSQCIADLNTVVSPDLTLVDATYAMTGRGPTGGDMMKLDTIIASEDPVASDWTAALELQKLEERMGLSSGLGFKAADVRHIRAAADLGVGTNNQEDIQVIEVSI